MLPWQWGSHGFEWRVRLTPNARLALVLETGASDTRLDLTDLRVSELTIKTGASSTRVSLPARAGSTAVRIASGAASVEVDVPQGVAARIRGSVGVGTLDVDQRRFARSAAGYESPDFETAVNRAEIQVESGVGSVRIR
jgi:N-acetylglucosamine kinase-like BadF-type ATPase